MPKFWQDIRAKISDTTKYIVKKLSILLLKGWNWRGKEKTNSYKKSKNRRGSKEVTIKRGEMVIFHEEMSCKMKEIKEKRNKW